MRGLAFHKVRDRGFTLVELLVVIAIIALLAGLLLPSLANAKRAGRNTQCEAHLKQWSVALLLYVDDFHRYPFGAGNDANGEFHLAEDLVARYLGPWSLVNQVRCFETWRGSGLGYGYNNFAATLTYKGSFLSLGRAGNLEVPTTVAENAVINPADTIAFTEYVVFPDPSIPIIDPGSKFSGLAADYPRTGKEDFYPHVTWVNQTFCDSHVEKVTRKQIASKSDLIRRRWFVDNKPHPELWPKI